MNRRFASIILIAAFAGCGPVTYENSFTVDSPAMHYESRSFYADPNVRPEDRFGYAQTAGVPKWYNQPAPRMLHESPMEAMFGEPDAELLNETGYIIGLVRDQVGAETEDQAEPVSTMTPGRPLPVILPAGDSLPFWTCKCGRDATGQCRVALPGTDEGVACRHRIHFKAWKPTSQAGTYMPVPGTEVVGCAWNTLSPRNTDLDHNRITIRVGDIGRQCPAP